MSNKTSAKIIVIVKHQLLLFVQHSLDKIGNCNHHDTMRCFLAGYSALDEDANRSNEHDLDVFLTAKGVHTRDDMFRLCGAVLDRMKQAWDRLGSADLYAVDPVEDKGHVLRISIRSVYSGGPKDKVDLVIMPNWLYAANLFAYKRVDTIYNTPKYGFGLADFHKADKLAFWNFLGVPVLSQSSEDEILFAKNVFENLSYYILLLPEYQQRELFSSAYV
jgi:hypothetical protein